jgi:aminopeptidase N
MARHIILFIVAIILVFSGCKRTRSFYEKGVSVELAQYRAKHISDVHYDLQFIIPENTSEPVTGKATIHFRQLKSLHGVNLDFQAEEENIHEVKANGQISAFSYLNQHIIIPSDHIVPGKNTLEITFTSSNQALNRSDDFMYTLFVPDRASTAFPCFDQPDLKATFNLTLEIANDWSALCNGKLTAEQTANEVKTLHFSMQQPISTYLFAFTAGRFQSLTQSHDGRSITMLHRETDMERLNYNAERIFKHHFESLKWLENYTGIPYPYEKFDIAVLPGFQYSGMEHPGAIWYRDERLMLDKHAPLMQRLRKANLIAHETAHMWFGNLVTMKWFDDVWLKEVFAGFMADKMIEPQFPEINHGLQFVLHHYPRAYSIDRSSGTHPIKQELANMQMAGSLYGPVIYNKAPIIFRQLEEIMQADIFQDAVKDYLQLFAHSNADWDDLANIFDRHSEKNISEWSQAWVYGKGMPAIRYQVGESDDSRIRSLTITQTNAADFAPFPAQYLSIASIYLTGTMHQEFWMDQPENVLPSLDAKRQPLLVVPNGGGMGYGYFIPSNEDELYLSGNIHNIDDENLKAAILINIHEDFLNAGINRKAYFDLLHLALSTEANAQLLSYLAGNMVTLTRNFLTDEDHSSLISKAELLLWVKLNSVSTESKQVFLDAWLQVALSPESLHNMQGLYNNALTIKDFPISDQNMTLLACEIALRTKNSNNILEAELQRLENPDRKRRLSFIMPALSGLEHERDAFFENLKNPENRNPEPWVLEALNYLHHPLHENTGIKYVQESLELLEEIKRTGDIFFPKNWLDATLGNYHGPETASIVNEYLENHPHLSSDLKQKVLQSADLLFRSANMIQNTVN